MWAPSEPFIDLERGPVVPGEVDNDAAAIPSWHTLACLDDLVNRVWVEDATRARGIPCSRVAGSLCA